jgi:capsular polysaccharide biosynthesis protein
MTVAQRSRWTDALATPSLRHVIEAAVVAILAAGLLATAVLQQAAVYSSSATLIIDQPAALAESNNEGYVVKLSRLRIKYGDLATTRALLDPVAERLNLDAATVRRISRVDVPPPSLLMFTRGESGNRVRAQQVAQTMAQELVNYVEEEQRRVGLPAEQRIVLSVVTPAPPAQKTGPNESRAARVAALGGILTFVVLYVLLRLWAALRGRV